MSSRRFNRVTFGVPVETFDISAYISVTERMPIVTEFVLKVVYTCDSISASALQEFFGFTHAEALAVVESMCRKSLLVMDGDVLRLSPYARAQFQSNDRRPSFHQIVSAKDSVTFDLLTFFPLPRGGLAGEGKGGGDQRSADGAIKLDASDEASGHSVERARAAYRQNYELIAFRREGYRERNFGVYSIEDIQGGRRRYAPINVSLSFTEDGEVQRQFDDQFEKVAPTELVNAVAEEVTRRLPPTLMVSGPALSEFVAVFEAKFLEPYMREKGFDLARYVADIQRDGAIETSRGVRPLFGNLYLSENLNGVVEGVESRLQGKRRKNPLITSVIWLAPDYSLWGRGESFAQAVRRLREALEEVSQDVYICAYAKLEREKDVKEQLRGPALSQLHFVRPPATTKGLPMGGRLEILLMPGGLVCALLHLSVSGSNGIWAPVGFVSSQPRHVEAARHLLVEAMSESGYGGKAAMGQGVGPAQHVAVEEAMPFLMNSGVQDSGEDGDDDRGRSDRVVPPSE